LSTFQRWLIKAGFMWNLMHRVDEPETAIWRVSIALVFHDLLGAHFASRSEFEEHLEENAFRVSVGHRRWRRHRSRRSDLLPRDFAAGSELKFE